MKDGLTLYAEGVYTDETMTLLRIVLAIGAGSIAALLAYGLAPDDSPWWAIGAGAAGISIVFLLGTFLMRDEDRDPTIRPPNLPYDDRRGD